MGTQKTFTATFNIDGEDRHLLFEPADSESKYVVTYKARNSQDNVTFTMRRDEAGDWKVEPQQLPIWVHRSWLLLHDAIVDNS